MGSQDTGGPAFPFERESFQAQMAREVGGQPQMVAIEPGMTLLDWFAGQVVASSRLGNNYGNRWAEEVYDAAAYLVAEKRRREAKAHG